MNNERNTSFVEQAARAIYEADPTLQPFDDLKEEEKEGYYLQAQAAVKAFLSSLETIVNESC
jgi:hypothetical protein